MNEPNQKDTGTLIAQAVIGLLMIYSGFMNQYDRAQYLALVLVWIELAHMNHRR